MTDKADLEKAPRSTRGPSPPTEVPAPDPGLAASRTPGNIEMQRAAALAQYPVLARLLPAEVLAGRASGVSKFPLRLLLQPELMFDDRENWSAYLANRRNEESDDAAARLLRNEMLRAYFHSIGLSMNEPVTVRVTPPLAPGDPPDVSFELKGRNVLTPDGTIGAAELAVFGPVEPIVAKVQRDAAYVERTAALLTAVAELKRVVDDMYLDVRLNPEDHALNEVRDVEAQVRKGKPLVDAWSCTSGPTLPAAGHLIGDYEDILQSAHDTTNFAKGWHNEHTMESAQQANARRGAAVGKWYDIPVAGFWALVETGEQVGTLGSHGTRTKISEAYADGNISWSEARDLVNKSARRAIIAASVMRILTPLLGQFGSGVLGGFEIGGTARTVASGVFGGAGGTAGQLAAQDVLTRFGGGSLSPAAQRLWSASGPGGRDWAIGLPLGGLLGGLNAARPVPPPAPPSVAPSGFFPKALMWARLRLGEPIMRGVSEQNAELLGGPTGVPALSMPATSGPISPSPMPFAPEVQVPVAIPSMEAPLVAPEVPLASAVQSSPASVSATVSLPVTQAIAQGYQPGIGERQTTREQWKQFSSAVRWENRMQRSFAEDAAYEAGDLEDIGRIRRPRQNVSVPFYQDIGLSDAQTAAAGRVFGKLWDAAIRQEWRACQNALAQRRMAEVQRLWNLGDPASRQAARDLARTTFNQWVGRFWRRIMNNATLRQMFTNAGLQVAAGRAPYYVWADGFEEGVTIEHWGSRLTDDPTRAVDDTNLMFSMHRENVHMLEALRRLGW